MGKFKWLTGVLSVLIVASGLSCLIYIAANPKRDYSHLLTIAARKGNLTVQIEENATLESANNEKIRSQVSGKNAITWLVENGAYVKKGDLLATIDSLKIEDQIHEQSKWAFSARASADDLQAKALAAELRISEYLEGQFPAQLKTMEKDLAVLESSLTTSRNLLRHTKSMLERGYVSELDLEEREFGVKVAELLVASKKVEIESLIEHTKPSELVRLQGDLSALRENYKAEAERAAMSSQVRDRFLGELKECSVYAERDGLVIRPKLKAWEESPIDEGTEVWETQEILWMPDLDQMQVKIGVHESMVKRIKPGLKAVVTLPHRTVTGEVSSVSPVSRSSGWWTGSAVKYDTFISLPAGEGLLPGTSAQIELIIASYKDVMLIPVDAVIESHLGCACWILTESGPTRRSIEVGDTDDVFIIVNKGLQVGDEVISRPLEHIEEAREEVTYGALAAAPAVSTES